MCVEDKRIVGTDSYASCQKVFSAAGLLAEKRAKDAGLPITYVSGTNIVKEFPDGSKKIIGTVQPKVVVNTTIVQLRKQD